MMVRGMPELILKLKERELKRIPILRETTKIGRDDTMDVVIDNAGISRHHASIVWDGDTFVVEDHGSQNGVFINGQRSDRWRLSEGDVIAMGKFALVFSRGGGITPARLMRDSPLHEPPEADPRAYNPIATTSLSSNDVQKLLDETMRKRAAERQAAQAAPQAAPAPPAAAFSGTLNSKSAADKYEQQTKSLKGLVMVLGLFVVVLLGVTVFLLTK